MIDTLPIDIITNIVNYFSDHEKLQFLSCTIIFDALKNKIIYDNQDDICVIDNICEDYTSYKKRFISPDYFPTMTSLFNTIYTNIHYETIYITFNDSFNESIDNIIFPPLIRKIIFGKNFNQPIGRYTCDTRMNVGCTFNFTIYINGIMTDKYYIHKYIPESVTHVTFGENFNQFINDFLPKQTKHVIYPNHNKPKNVSSIEMSIINWNGFAGDKLLK